MKYYKEVDEAVINTVKADVAEAASGVKPMSSNKGTIIGPPPIPSIPEDNPPIRAVIAYFLDSFSSWPPIKKCVSFPKIFDYFK